MPKHDEQGIALILALLVLALLGTLILEFDADARREHREAAAFRDNFKATTLTRAGVQAAKAILQKDHMIDKLSKQSFDGLTDIWAVPISSYAIGDGILSAQIEDERGKFNLNELGVADPKTREIKLTRAKRLFNFLQIKVELVDVIADWIDADDVPEPNGAESAYYQTVRPAYRSANAPLESLAELYLLKGMTREIVQRLAKYVTVYPKEAGGVINLNTADPLVIQSLDARITQSMAAEIVQARPYRTMQDVDQVGSFSDIAKELRVTQTYDVKTNFFFARMTITVNDVSKTAHVVLRRDDVSGDSTVQYFRVM
ncbi:MAG: type II secretion system minor pseudopilin GspK [Nitrospiraceae bacterium]